MRVPPQGVLTIEVPTQAEADRVERGVRAFFNHLEADGRVEKIYTWWCSRHGLDVHANRRDLRALSRALDDEVLERDVPQIERLLVQRVHVPSRYAAWTAPLVLHWFRARCEADARQLPRPSLSFNLPPMPESLSAGKKHIDKIERDVDWWYRATIRRRPADAQAALQREFDVTRTTLQSAIDRAVQTLDCVRVSTLTVIPPLPK